MAEQLRLAIFSSGLVGGKAFEIMIDAGHVPVLVVIDGSLNREAPRICQRLSERGLTNAVIDYADAPPASLAAIIRERSVDIVILAWWQLIITEPVLSAPRIGFLNFHPSFLPHNRGRHSAFWNLVEDTPFGVTLHWIDKGIDSGPIAFQRSIQKSWGDTAESLYRKAQREILELFSEHLSDIVAGQIPRQPQDLKQGTTHYAKDIQSATRIDLDRSLTARELFNLVRAAQFPPHAPAWFEELGEEFDITITIERRKA